MYRTVSIGSLVKSSPSKFSWLGCSISQVCTMILYQYLGTNCLLNDYRSTKNIWTPCGCDCVLHKLVHLILTLLCSQWLTGGVCVVRRGRIDQHRPKLPVSHRIFSLFTNYVAPSIKLFLGIPRCSYSRNIPMLICFDNDVIRL